MNVADVSELLRGFPESPKKQFDVMALKVGAVWGTNKNLLSQWLTFKLFGITYKVGKIKFKFLFYGPLAE